MHVAVVCLGLLGLLVFGLGLAVSMQRGSSKTIIGHSADPADPLHKLVRAHGNATEFVPMLAVLILYLGSREPAAWLEWTFVLATASRYVHAAGMVLSPSLDRPQPLRAIGATGTYLTGLTLAVAALIS
jgi:uncharacterized membrane protein YecN with MAPEG domain